MNRHRLGVCLTALLFVAFILALAPATAANTAAKPPPPEDPRKLVKSVDVPNNIVVIQYMRDKTLHTYTIDDLTKLTVNNEDGKIAAIKPGMVVDDFLERTDTILDSLTLSGYGETVAPKPAVKPKPKPPVKPTTPPASSSSSSGSSSSGT